MWYYLKMNYYWLQPLNSMVALEDVGKEFHPVGRPSDSALVIYLGQQMEGIWTHGEL